MTFGKGRKMRTTYKTILILTVVSLVLLSVLPCWAAEKEDDKGQSRRSGRMGRHHELGERGERGPRGPEMGMMQQHYDEYIKWLEKNYPQKAEELKGLKDKNPRLYRRQVGYGMRKHRKIIEAEKESPELAKVLTESMELDGQRNKLIKKLRSTEDEAEKKEITGELEKVLGSKFDLTLKRKEIELGLLQKRLEELKKELKTNQENIGKWKDPEFKQQQIKERLERLISDKEEFRWE